MGSLRLYWCAHAGMADCWKMRELARILNHKDSDSLYGKLARLFEYAIEKAPDGNITNLDPKGLERRCNWSGDAHVFFDALFETEWLERREDGSVHITGWMEHSGKLHLSRIADTRRKQIERKNPRKQNRSSKKHVRRTSVGRPRTSSDKTGHDVKNASSEQTHTDDNVFSGAQDSADVVESTLGSVRRTSGGHHGTSERRSYSFTTSDSDVVTSSNQVQATAARAVSDEKPLQPFAPQKKSSLPSSAALRADQTSTSRPNTTPPCSERPMPSTQSCQANQSDIQAPPASTARAAVILQSPARLLMQQNPSAPAVTPPFAEIVETGGLSMAKIEDMMRCGFGAPVQMSVKARQLFKEVLAETPITQDMLTEAHTRAHDWHKGEGSRRVRASTVAQMLESVIHEMRQKADIASNVMGAAHKASLDNRQPAPRLTRREEAQGRAFEQAMLLIQEQEQDMLEMEKARAARKKLKERG